MSVQMMIMLMGLCLIVEGFFSGSEIGVVSADRLKLRHMAAKGNRGARLAVEMLKKPEWLLSTTLVGTNIAIVSNTTLATLLAVELFGPKYSWMAIPIVAPLIWVFGEIVPKSIFQQRADQLTPKVIFVLKAASVVFFPILMFFTTMTKMLTRVLKGKQEKSMFTLREEIDLILQMDSGGGDISKVERQMILRAFDYGRTQTRDIMIPYVDVNSIANTATCQETLEMAGRQGHPLLPVFDGRVDRVVGQISTLDLLGEAGDVPIKSFIKPIRFVYGSKRLEELLDTFRRDGDRIAIVVDEFGGADGLISMKDIMERIVGSIKHEHAISHDGDQVGDDIVKVNDGEYMVNPRMDLVAFKQVTGIHLNDADGNFETLSGFLLEMFGDIPQKDAVYEFEGNRFIVEACSDKRIEVVRVATSSG
ncbi:MAG: HlyC/CorC family transporter [Magnetococcales bacterium]|nr:HlyC/CorC family transporter [Magnetococcales bacterium]